MYIFSLEIVSAGSTWNKTYSQRSIISLNVTRELYHTFSMINITIFVHTYFVHTVSEPQPDYGKLLTQRFQDDLVNKDDVGNINKCQSNKHRGSISRLVIYVLRHY